MGCRYVRKLRNLLRRVELLESGEPKYRDGGSKTISELNSSLLTKEHESELYNITDSGVTTSNFIEGADIPINAGDNVTVVEFVDDYDNVSYKFDLLSVHSDTSEFVRKSLTQGLIKNDGTIDTNTYLTQPPNQKYVTVTATSQTTSATDVLPATGEADTVYRIGNWSGTQYDVTSYTEYSWDGSDYVPLSTKTQIGEVFDISAYHATGGTLATYADLSAALDSNNNGGVPQSLQKGGMSVKFVQSSDNKYVQYRLMAQSFTTDVTQWQGVDSEPVSQSKNLLESSGAFRTMFPVMYFVGNGDTYVSGSPTNAILLANHNYRFHILGFDLTGVTIPAGYGIITILGKDDEDNKVSIVDIKRVEGTFTYPATIDYKPTQNIHDLRFSGRNSNGVRASVIVEDLEDKYLPFELTLNGNGINYTYGYGNLTLYPGTYRCDVRKWDNSGLTYNGETIVISGVNSSNVSVILVTVDNRNYTGIPEYINFTVEEILYNVKLSGRAKLGTKGIVTISEIKENSFPTFTLLGTNAYNTRSLKSNGILLKGHRYRFYITGIDLSGVILGPTQGVISAQGYTEDNTPVLCFSVKRGSAVTFVCPEYVEYTPDQNLYNLYISGRNRLNKETKVVVEDISVIVSTLPLDFPVMGSGSKMMSLPSSTYVHLPSVIETKNYIFTIYHSSDIVTEEVVADHNDIVLCVINKYTGEQWYQKIVDYRNLDVVDSETCHYCHNFNMMNVSDDKVVINISAVNANKMIVYNKSYNAATKTLSAAEKSKLSYGGNTYDLTLKNYIEMVNSLYGLSIPVVEKVKNSIDLWVPCKYVENNTTKYMGLFSFRTIDPETSPITPYIMMNSSDCKSWSPMFLLCNDLENGETQPVVLNNKIYITNRIGGSFDGTGDHGQFYAVCDMSGNFLKNWTKLNVQRTRPCEVLINGAVYIIYNDGNNSGKYWGRRKFNLCKVNADYSITEIQSWSSPHGLNYPCTCDHNGAILLAYAEDRRGLNATNGKNAITDIAAAQIFLP